MSTGWRVPGSSIWWPRPIFDDTESLQYFQRLIRKKGVIDALEAAGVAEGDLVALDDFEFEYIK
jgi:GTP-binding protein